MNRMTSLFLALFVLLGHLPLWGQGEKDGAPVILGRGVGLFELGPLLEKDDFGSLDRWVVQIEEKRGGTPARVEIQDGALDCFLPNRGCTIWFRKKLGTRTVISYEVICPAPTAAGNGIQVKDVNNFWLANDPRNDDGGLFDPSRYNGNFTSYHKMSGYYASSGGGKNTTTRMRRYPREVDGELVKHLALKDKDGKKEFLLTPNKRMRVQLVAFDDFIQYIVDGKLVYEMAFGDRVASEQVTAGKRVASQGDYNAQDDPFYTEGYFGFRMVGTHHRYSKFRVHELVPVKR